MISNAGFQFVHDKIIKVSQQVANGLHTHALYCTYHYVDTCLTTTDLGTVFRLVGTVVQEFIIILCVS